MKERKLVNVYKSLLYQFLVHAKRSFYIIPKTFVLLICCFGCQSSSTTPETFKNKVSVPPNTYNAHRDILVDSVSSYVSNRKSAYYPKENDSLTKVFIDSIVYSPQEDKLAFFVITGNSDAKLNGGGASNKLHFDAHCFIANVVDGYTVSNIRWLAAHNLTNYSTYGTASARIRDVYFHNLRGSQPNLRYNLDDKRFWTDKNIWGPERKYTEIFEDDK